MADGHGLVAASAVDDAEIGHLRHGEVAAAEAVNDDLPLWVNGPDGGDGPAHQRGVIIAGQPVLAHRRRLVEQVKAEGLAGDALEAPGERFPQKDKAS